MCARHDHPPYDTPTPATQAGREANDDTFHGVGCAIGSDDGPDHCACGLTVRILAIEAEAFRRGRVGCEQHSPRLECGHCQKAEASASAGALREALERMTPDYPWERERPGEGMVTTDEPWYCAWCFANVPYNQERYEQPEASEGHGSGCDWLLARASLAAQPAADAEPYTDGGPGAVLLANESPSRSTSPAVLAPAADGATGRLHGSDRPAAALNSASTAGVPVPAADAEVPMTPTQRDELRELATRARDYVPTSFDEADDMCPNCVTPWKCNGPHETKPVEQTPLEAMWDALDPQTVLALLDAAEAGERLERAVRDFLAAWPNIANHPRFQPENVEIAALRAALATPEVRTEEGEG